MWEYLINDSQLCYQNFQIIPKTKLFSLAFELSKFKMQKTTDILLSVIDNTIIHIRYMDTSFTSTDCNFSKIILLSKH